MSGWTKGPWVLTPKSYGHDLTAVGVGGGYGGWFVELHSGLSSDDPRDLDETFQANAHLIAASPAMYSELDELVGELESFHDSSSNHALQEWAAEQIASIRSVLAKARGETP